MFATSVVTTSMHKYTTHFLHRDTSAHCSQSAAASKTKITPILEECVGSLAVPINQSINQSIIV